MKPGIIITYLIFALQISMKAQIVHAGIWTGYLDRLSISRMVMRDSHIYLLTQQGMAHFNTESRVCNFFNDLGNFNIPAHIGLFISDIDAQGKLWTISDQQLINILPDGTVNIIGPAPAYKVSYMKFDHNDQLWAGMDTENTTTSSLVTARFINSWEYFFTDSAPASKVIHMAFDSQNKPYLLTPSIYEFNGTNFQLFPVQVPFPSAIKEIYFSNDGQMIVLPFLKKYQNGAWISNSAYMDNAAFDENNVLWTAQPFGGTYKNFPPVFELGSPANFRSVIGAIGDMEFDTHGNLWIGGRAGLFTKSPDSSAWEFVPTDPLLTPYKPHVMAADKDTAWMVSSGPTSTIQPGKIIKYYNHTFQTYDLPLLDVRSMRYDTIRKGLWIGCVDNQLGFLKNGVYTQVDISQFSYQSIRDIQQDRAGNIWITSFATVLRYSLNGNWHIFTAGVELPTLNVAGISVLDTTVYVSLTGSVGGPGAIPKIVKIDGDIVTDMNIHVGYANIGWPGYFAAQNDSTFWYTVGGANSNVYRWKNGVTTGFTASDLGGSIGQQQVFMYDTSTVLVCSSGGFYFYKNDTWYKPIVPSTRITNTTCLPSALSGKKLYMSHAPLLVLEDMEALFDELVPVRAPSSGTDYSRLIFPNPASNKTNIDPEILENHPDCRLSLYDFNGVLLRQYKAPLPPDIDTQNLTSGVYFLQFWSFQDGFKQVVKMVKN